MKFAPVRIAAAVMLLAFAASPAWARSPLLKEFEDAFIRLGEEVRPSVVEITATADLDTAQETVNELFRFFGQPEGEEGEGDDGGEGGEITPERPAPPRLDQAPTATGSGFIIDKEGHIITNNHVVAQAVELSVELWNGMERKAEVIGTDPDTDLALLKIEPDGLDLPTIELGDSDGLKVGQFAIAMGSPRGLTGSLSFGHISGLGREQLAIPDEKLRFQNFIQTDAAINLGNSGGPLCDIDGRAIGVNIAIVFNAQSIGFAIPINRVKEIVPQLKEHGRVVRGWLGVKIQNVDQAAFEKEVAVDDFVSAFKLPGTDGSFVSDVVPDGPAAKAGLKADDYIYRIDGKPVANTYDLISQISAFPPGTEIDLDIYREGERQSLTVTLGEFTTYETAQWGEAVLGMHVLTLTPDLLRRNGLSEDFQGVPVVAVAEGSPAADAGIEAGDFILKVAHKSVNSREELFKLIGEEAEPGKALLVRIVRPPSEDEESKFIKIPEDFQPGE